MPRGLIVVVVWHGLLAVGLGGRGLLAPLGWLELTFGEVMITLVCTPVSVLSAVSSVGLALRRSYGRVAAIIVGWLVAIGAGSFVLLFAGLFLHTYIKRGYLADVFMFGFAVIGLIALGVFAINGWSMIYLRRANIRKLFDAKQIRGASHAR